MNYEPAMDGPDGPTNPPGDASAPRWPVLARLPYVGEAAEHEASAVGELRAMPAVQSKDSTHSAPTSDARSSRRPRYRFDAAEPCGAVTAAPMRIVSPHDEPTTFAAQMFQWHATAAPYAGVATTFALAMFAGLLYWSTFGRSDAPTSEPLAAQWAAEVDRTPSPLSPSPMIRLETPAISELAVEPEEVAAVTPLETAPAVSAVREEAKPMEAASTEPAVGEEPQLTAAGETTDFVADAQAPVVPTPLSISYPSTPFASFDFGAAAEQAVTPNETLAPGASR